MDSSSIIHRYLVLGSSGFIGRNLCKYLRSQNCNVLEFDIKNSLDEDLRIIDNPELNLAIKSSDFIFFLAFDIGGSKFLQNCSHEKNFLLNNTKIISATFETLMKFDKKIIFISSYLTKNFEHSYGLLKLLGEHFTHSFNGLVVRLYNVYGNEDFSIRSHIIPDIVYQAKKNNVILLKTNGEEKRQFLYIDDCCEGLFIASQNYNEILTECNIIDLTSFEWVTIKRVAELVGEKLKCTVKFSHDNAMFNTECSPNIFFRKYWTPKTSFQSGLTKILDES